MFMNPLLYVDSLLLHITPHDSRLLTTSHKTQKQFVVQKRI